MTGTMRLPRLFVTENYKDNWTVAWEHDDSGARMCRERGG